MQPNHIYADLILTDHDNVNPSSVYRISEFVGIQRDCAYRPASSLMKFCNNLISLNISTCSATKTRYMMTRMQPIKTPRRIGKPIRMICSQAFFSTFLIPRTFSRMHSNGLTLTNKKGISRMSEQTLTRFEVTMMDCLQTLKNTRNISIAAHVQHPDGVVVAFVNMPTCAFGWSQRLQRTALLQDPSTVCFSSSKN